MKKIFVLSVIGLFVLIHLFVYMGIANAETGQNEWLQRIHTLYGKQQYAKALETIDQALKAVGNTNELLQLKYNILLKLQRYDEAMTFVDGEIKKSGESEQLLAAKYNLLLKQGNLAEALKFAMKKDKISKQKSPWDSMNIVHIYLRMGSNTDALDWLQESVARGFISYRLLQGERYAPLQKEMRFFEIIESIKMSIGLGYPAKNITVKLLSGDDFTLANQKGKVVLIYFWAVWCEPCKMEIPQLNQIYQEFKDQDFEILGISLDSSKKKMEDFIKQNKLEWKHSCSGKVWKDEAVVRYGVNNLPSLWLIDKSGILRSVDIKGNDLRDVLSQLLPKKK